MFDIMEGHVNATETITHIITVEPGTKPIKQKTRGIPQAFQAEFKRTIKEMKDSGMIVDSKSPWCSPVRLVKKPDGSIRVCIDFRKLNSVTKKDSYPIPKIDNLFTHLAKAKVYSTIDLASGYHQVKMDPNSREYTAFATQWGFYEYTVMAMGLTNACATFQRLMEKVLDGYIGVCCLVYLDDIILYSETLDQHKIDVENIITRLKAFNLKIKPSKCKFARSRIEYLSHVIENGTLKPNPAKTAAVNNAKIPKTVKQVQAFLGLVGYYRKFIKNCSGIASPLIKLTEKNTEFKWSEECESAFQQLKSYLVSDKHVLALPDYDKEFVVEADASKVGIGGVLSQKIGRHYQPIAYFSKHLTKTERNYSTSERELLAIILSVEHFKEYVYGRQFKILSDHEPLKFLATTDVPSPRLARLQRRLNIYNQVIEYRAGKNHGNADALSRMVDEEEEDGIEQPEDTVINVIKLKQNTNNSQLLDGNLKWIMELLQANKTRPIITEFENIERKSLYTQWNRLKITNKILFREYLDQYDRVLCQYVVPKSEREFVLKNSHDTVCCGHLGYEKTRERIVHKYYWYKCAQEIKTYCEECVKCQQFKTSNKYNTAKLKPYVATRPNQMVSADVFGPIPTTARANKYILVVTDLFTKYVEFFPLETQSAHETARKMIEYISRHSVMEQILTDQGRNFQSELLSEIWECLDVHKTRTTPYFPSANGQAERMMRSMQNMLANYVNEQKNNWDDYLPLLQLAYNTAVHSSHKYTPFELQFGRDPKLPLDLMSQRAKIELYFTPDSYATMLQNELPNVYKQVKQNIELSVKPNKIRHDRTVRAAVFKVNEYCWVLDTAKLKGVSKKLSHRWKGPYIVVEVIDDANYKVKLVQGKKTITVNKSRLKRCYERKILEDMNNNTVESSTLHGETVVEDTVETGAKPSKGKKGKKKNNNKKGPGKPKQVVQQLPVPTVPTSELPSTDSIEQQNKQDANTRPKRHRVAPDRYGQSK
jgi:hypothetical protein